MRPSDEPVRIVESEEGYEDGSGQRVSIECGCLRVLNCFFLADAA